MSPGWLVACPLQTASPGSWPAEQATSTRPENTNRLTCPRALPHPALEPCLETRPQAEVAPLLLLRAWGRDDGDQRGRESLPGSGRALFMI